MSQRGPRMTVRGLLTEALRGFSFSTDRGNIVIFAAPSNVLDALRNKGWCKCGMYSVGWRIYVRLKREYRGKLAATDLATETPFQVRLMKAYGY